MRKYQAYYQSPHGLPVPLYSTTAKTAAEARKIARLRLSGYRDLLITWWKDGRRVRRIGA